MTCNTLLWRLSVVAVAAACHKWKCTAGAPDPETIAKLAAKVSGGVTARHRAMRDRHP
jgi:hypothetical protein